jgi:hypothetical protein
LLLVLLQGHSWWVLLLLLLLLLLRLLACHRHLLLTKCSLRHLPLLYSYARGTLLATELLLLLLAYTCLQLLRDLQLRSFNLITTRSEAIFLLTQLNTCLFVEPWVLVQPLLDLVQLSLYVALKRS